MPTIIDVMNRALSRIGAQNITARSDASPEARAVDTAWDIVRREVLRDHNWNCVTQRVALPELGTDPAFGWDKQYQVPAGCLRVLEVLDDAGGPTSYPWVVEGQNILTDLSGPIEVRYLKDIDDPNVWDPQLVSAMSARLAAEIARALASKSERDDQLVQYQRIVTRAKMMDAQEQASMELQEDDWITVRW